MARKLPQPAPTANTPRKDIQTYARDVPRMKSWAVALLHHRHDSRRRLRGLIEPSSA